MVNALTVPEVNFLVLQYLSSALPASTLDTLQEQLELPSRYDWNGTPRTLTLEELVRFTHVLGI